MFKNLFTLSKNLNRPRCSFATLQSKLNPLSVLDNCSKDVSFSGKGSSILDQFSGYKRIGPSALTQYSQYISDGLNHLDKADPQAAHQLFQKAYKLSTKLFGDQSKNTAICLTYIAQAHKLDENIGRSLECYDKALRITSQEPNFCPTLNSDIFYNMSIVYQSQGEMSRALENGRKSLNLMEEYAPEDDQRISLILQSLGKTYLIMGDLVEAKTFLEKALQVLLRDEAKNAVELCLLYEKIGKLMEKKGKIHEAIRYKTKALEINSQTQIKGEESTLFAQYLHLAALYEKVEKYQESFAFLEKAFDLVGKDKKSKEKIHKGPLLVRMGQMLLKMGEVDRAIESVQEGIRLLEAENLGETGMARKARRILDKAYGLKGKHKKSAAAPIEEQSTSRFVMESRIVNNIEEAERLRQMGYEKMKKYDVSAAQNCFVKALQGFSLINGSDCKECQELKRILGNLQFCI